MTIENLDINTLNFSGFNSNCSIQVNSCRVHAFQFYDLINNNDLLLTNIQSLKKDFPSRFVITESRLGKAHWYNVNLHSFDRIVYRDSDIAEMSVSHVTWFNGKQYSDQLKITKGLSGEQKHELREQFKRQRDLFRQLKVVMDRQGDKAYSLEFFKWEMWNYKKVVKLRGTIWDRFVLLIGQTNDYGNNWIKPLAILGVLSFIIYIPIALLSSPELDHSISLHAEDLQHSLRIIAQDIRYWFQLLNPAHSLDRMMPGAEKLSWTVYLLDLFDRIVVSLFIYQVIIAFRKYYRH